MYLIQIFLMFPFQTFKLSVIFGVTCTLSLLHICFPCKIKFFFLANFHSIFSTVFTFHAIALCVCHLILSLLGFWGVLGGLWLLWVRGQLNSGILRDLQLAEWHYCTCELGHQMCTLMVHRASVHFGHLAKF